MTLNIMGIGLNDEKDITLKCLELVKKADFVYLENYTSKLNCNLSYLEKLYGKKIILADRKLVEMDAEKTILQQAREKEVAFLVVGDVFSATTHMDLYLRAKKLGIKTIREWIEAYKAGKIPSNLPSDPFGAYAYRNKWRIKK